MTCEVTEAHPYDLVAADRLRPSETGSDRTVNDGRPARAGRPHGHYQISRAPSCIWRGSPRPLAIVPSKLKTRLVVCGLLAGSCC